MVVDQQQLAAKWMRWFNEKGLIEWGVKSCGAASSGLAKWENFFESDLLHLYMSTRDLSRKNKKWHLNSVRSGRGKQSSEECSSKKFNYIHTQQLFQFFLDSQRQRRRRRNFHKHCHRSMSATVVELPTTLRLGCVSAKHYPHKHSMRTQTLMLLGRCGCVHASQESL